VEARRRAARSWVGYYWYREVMRQLDTLPGVLPLGVDFDCLLRKPPVATIPVGEVTPLAPPQTATSPAG
jgi:hypothetical protein